MITKISRIADYRAFKEWRWTNQTPPFATVNLFYGINGAGKSTVASLLQEAQSDLEWNSGLEVEVETGPGKRDRINAADQEFWQQIRVFNRAYVEANLEFDAAYGGCAEALLVLGEQSIARRSEEDTARQRLAKIAEDLPETRRELKRATNLRNKIPTETAKRIVQELGQLGGRFSGRRYTATQVKHEIARGVDTQALAEHAVDDDLTLVRSEHRPPLPLPAAQRFVLADIARALHMTVKETPTAKVIANLLDAPQLAHWVQEGLRLHEEKTECMFCTNEITDARRADLAAHFDDSVRDLQARIDGLQQQIEQLRQESTGAMQELPREIDLFEVARPSYVQALQSAQEAHAGFLADLAQLEAVLSAKRDALFSPIEDEASLTMPLLSLQEVARAIEKHNSLAEEFAHAREAAAQRIEHVRIGEIVDRYLELDADATQYAHAIETLCIEQVDLETALSLATESDLDPRPLARDLNDDLTQLLGRDELAFEVTGDGYSITRNGIPARHLSEGERNAISLLYFLRSLQSHSTDAKRCVVIIDDPVSSLDGNALMGASTHLWAKLIDETPCRQLFLLTHNFELFRMWALELDRATRSGRTFSHNVYEIRSTLRQTPSGALERTPVIVSWPVDRSVRKRLRSEYHYIFWRVAETLRECLADPSPQRDIEAAAIMPNVCRRLLEGFLGFKCPAAMGNLRKQIMSVGPKNITPAKRNCVLRFVHAYSHNETADTTTSAARPEAVEMLGAVLAFMRGVDKEHFTQMCRAVGVDEQIAALPLP